MNKLLILFFGIFSLGQFGRVFSIGEATLHLNDLFVGFFTLFFIFKKIIHKEKEKWTLDKIGKSALLFVFFCLFSLLINISQYELRESAVAFLYLLRFIVYFCLYLLFINLKINKHLLIKSFLIIPVIIALIGLGQYYFFPDLRFLAVNNWDPHFFRLTAPFFDPTFTGVILSLGLIFWIVYYWDQKKTIFTYLFPSLIYLALSLTYSRGSYLSYFISMSIISLVKKSPKFFLLIIFFGLFTYYLLPKEKSYGTNLQRSETVFARWDSWNKAVNVWKIDPIFGVGFNAYRYAKKDYQNIHGGAGSDSSLLFVLATTGVLGFLAYLNLIKNIIIKSWENLKEPFHLILFSSVIGLLVHSLFSNSLFYPWIMEWMWLLIILI